MKQRHTVWKAACLSAGLLIALSWGCGEKGKDKGGDGTVEVVTGDSTLGDSATVEQRIARITEQLGYSRTNWELWNQRSQLWYEAGNVQRAMADIDIAIENHNTAPENYYLKGFYYYAQKKDSLAVINLQKAADLASDDPEGYYLLGQLRFLEGEYDAATKAYNTAISLDSMAPTYYFARGFMAESRKQYDKAISEYDMALKRDPTFVKALLALHDIFLTVRKDPDQAFVFNERVILIDSTQPVARFNQGNFFMARANKMTDPARFPEFSIIMKIAMVEYTKTIETDPNFVQAYYNRGYCSYLLEQFNRALDDFSTVISLDPYNDKAFFMKASIQEAQGDLVSALENYRQSVKINPDFREASEAVKELSAKVKQDETSGS
jgi:tetratricopeptide (TPR) repeat protein